jgi:hypothetical protein
MTTQRKTQDPAPPTGKRWVRLDAPGVRAVGPYRHGECYEVDAAEAERLCRTKGLVPVDGPRPEPTPEESES